MFRDIDMYACGMAEDYKGPTSQVPESEFLGAKIVSMDTQRAGMYQPQIIVKKGKKKYSICCTGIIQLTEVK